MDKINKLNQYNTPLPFNTTILPLLLNFISDRYDILYATNPCIGFNGYFEKNSLIALNLASNFSYTYHDLFLKIFNKEIHNDYESYEFISGFTQVYYYNYVNGRDIKWLNTKYNVDLDKLYEVSKEFIVKELTEFKYGHTNNYFLARITNTNIINDILNAIKKRMYLDKQGLFWKL